MFGGAYPEDDTLARDRVKYGVLNFCADPGGVCTAFDYGDCQSLWHRLTHAAVLPACIRPRSHWQTAVIALVQPISC